MGNIRPPQSFPEQYNYAVYMAQLWDIAYWVTKRYARVGACALTNARLPRSRDPLLPRRQNLRWCTTSEFLVLPIRLQLSLLNYWAPVDFFGFQAFSQCRWHVYHAARSNEKSPPYFGALSANACFIDPFGAGEGAGQAECKILCPTEMEEIPVTQQYPLSWWIELCWNTR